jgi:two-component system OmpR family sensor kinase
VSRLPIRLRLTLAFAAAMAAVLALTGTLLYLGLRSSLDEAINDGLETRLADIAAGAGRGADSEERLTQVISQTSERPILDPDELEQVEAGERLRLEREVPGLDGRARLLASEVDTPQGRRAVVAGASLEDRDEALRELLGQLVLVGPAALLLASLLGYGIATAALRPVESMRAEAAAISGAEPGRRLPLSSARDEISRLGETLNEMLARLEAALARERSFVADASHELRTPLALLKGELDLTLRRPRSAEELESALRSAATETDRLGRLAEDLLVLARSDQGRLGLKREPIATRDIAIRVAERFAPPAGAIEVDVPDGLRFSGDRVRIEQALADLVANALEHGSRPVRISARDRDGSVELHVVDEGPGFPAEFLPRAFERFTRADEARSGGGAGLGLAIVAAIASAHGGSAHAANRTAGGADVWLSIPIAGE